MEQRRRFEARYKIEAIRMITEQGKSAPQVARDIGVHEVFIRGWSSIRLMKITQPG